MVRKTLIISASFAANTPANYVVAGTITDPPRQYAEYVVPKGKSLTVLDAYIKASGDVGVDAVAIFKVNEVEAGKTAPLSTTLISNPSRPRITPFTVDEFGKLKVDVMCLAAVGSTAATDTFYIDVEEAPAAKKTSGILERLKIPF